MTRDTLERHQVWVYLAAILAGLALGSARPTLASVLDVALWPLLALLLYVTFTQASLANLSAAFKDTRFIVAALIGNFGLLPLVVAGILHLMPADPALQLGLALVLLVPCTDWFITFAHQSGGDLRQAIAMAPVLLLVQMLALPLYLWLFLGPEVVGIVSGERMITVFVSIVALPLILAWLTERWAGEHARRKALLGRLGWLAVPMLAIVLMLVAASQADAVQEALVWLPHVLAACAVFLAAAVGGGVALTRACRLSSALGRTLTFSFATRNSFVVLPFALALPAAWQVAALVIVLQSLVELFAMLLLLWLSPMLLPDEADLR